MFRRVLIANRGEIAARIAGACEGLGVESVVVHSEADRGAPWLERATRAVCVGPARAAESYLNATAILQAAEQYDCQAVHPGYGFLAENAIFAARCEQQGISFVGPGAAAIRSMGDKAEAKRTLSAAGLPTLPGSDGPVADIAAAQRTADEVGYPVLLKAVAGGGGKGMRRCAAQSDLASAFEQATLEAQKAFGDGSLYVEKLIEQARHVEFQVLCDGYGNGIHLGERECSIQRRHQKLIEEAPSPAVSVERRREFGARVAASVTACGYRNAGTVEFLLTPDGNFYFMEMNTRLQVEHPVTEMVTGVDIVQEQLRIAANQPLSIEQDEVGHDGHAIEFRINAEDPAQDFRPDPGTITALEPPRVEVDGARVRWDSGVGVGYTIPPYYDSMIGKLIVHASSRTDAMLAGAQALESLTIGGVSTTLGLHRRLIGEELFRSGDYHVASLESSGLLETL